MLCWPVKSPLLSGDSYTRNYTLSAPAECLSNQCMQTVENERKHMLTLTSSKQEQCTKGHEIF